MCSLLFMTLKRSTFITVTVSAVQTTSSSLVLQSNLQPWACKWNVHIRLSEISFDCICIPPHHTFRILQHLSFESDALGPVADVGAKLAESRSAKLIDATERQTEGVLFYAFDFALDDGTHQLLQLCVNKGKIWSLDANTKEKRYGKRKEMYYNVLGSFMPKLSS
jgi:hypothetical protein